MAADAFGEPVLVVENLQVEYATHRGSVRAVDQANLSVRPGEFVGIVGESGSGKSTLMFAITRLLGPSASVTGGRVSFLGNDMVSMTEAEVRHLRWQEFSVVMQSAMNALNPVQTVGAQMRDACKAHGQMNKKDVRDRSAEMLKLVGIDPLHLKSYPHQLSGGMRQRAMIAMALLFTPQLVVMDEPTSSLDVVAQRSLMIQIKRLQEGLGFAVLFVTHDMSLVGRVADRLAVMYAGKLVELGPTGEIFGRPMHPYTRGLMEASLTVQSTRERLTGIPGSPPDLGQLPVGCRFHPRCVMAKASCKAVDPPPVEIQGRTVRCLRVSEVFADGE